MGRPRRRHEDYAGVPKPKNHRAGEKPTTTYVFDQEAVWLLQAHVLYGGTLAITVSQHSRYYYPSIRGLPGLGKPAFADRLVANCAPQYDALLADPSAYHDHTRGNIKSTHQRKIAQRVGPENERARDPKVTRTAAIAASCQLWRPSLLFPTAADYSDAFRQVYDALDRLPLGDRPVADT